MHDLVLKSVLEAQLVEILLGLILTFNIGAYSFLWYKIRRVEEEVDENSDMLLKLFKRIFGIEEDETDKGHLVETNKEFDEMERRLDGIEDKIDLMANSNKESHQELQAMFQQLSAILVEEENIDVDYSDIEEIKR